MVPDARARVVRSHMAAKTLRKRLSAFVTSVAAVGLGAGMGGLMGRRLVDEMRDLDAEQITALAKKYVPLLMATAGKSIDADKVGGTYKCDDCAKEFMPIFMLRDDLWWSVLTEEERPRQFNVETREPLCPGCDDGHKSVALCMSCCSNRLDRPLRPSDFDDDYWTSSMLADAAESVRPAPPDPAVAS